MPKPTTLALLLALAACVAPVAAQETAAAPAAESTPVPPPPAWLPAMDALYPELRVSGLDPRDFDAEHWWQAVTPLLDRSAGFHIEDIGRSAEDRPLRHVRWGRGKTRVLLWSQMHGDESTGTMVLADLFRFLGEHPDHPVAARLRANTTLHFLPMVNPDGAARFQRRNTQGIDINRDARMLATPEARALKALHDRVRPAYGFNLHDQSPGYRVGDSGRGTAIALLAPPPSAANEVDPARARAIEVAATIRIALEPYLAGHIARWDETFNPRAFGDLTAQWGTSTVLIEAGGIEGDPQKQALRKLHFLGLLAALDAIAGGSHAGTPHALYRDLPENGEPWPDLRVVGGTLAIPGQPPVRADLLVNFRHPLSWEDGSIRDIGDLADTPARRTIDASGLFVVPALAAGGEAAGPCRIAISAAACFHLARDPEGRDPVWTLRSDLDTAQPAPGAGH
ncbi:M14 family zinc carboxypeptidase [Pseudoxanthomonas suwonensis]|uniref:M14 family zinc carboxypeptidase n=1 Tax=Pseudoxanthomonas suwonensis TaxID=314722 RepID=UPI0009E20F4F|nr:M14 family zinc carboxypeptidase [Pseudoxanthomonas suwonensis]